MWTQHSDSSAYACTNNLLKLRRYYVSHIFTKHCFYNTFSLLCSKLLFELHARWFINAYENLNKKFDNNNCTAFKPVCHQGRALVFILLLSNDFPAFKCLLQWMFPYVCRLVSYYLAQKHWMYNYQLQVTLF